MGSATSGLEQACSSVVSIGPSLVVLRPLELYTLVVSHEGIFGDMLRTENILAFQKMRGIDMIFSQYCG